MALGLRLASLSRRVLSQCRATSAALPLRPSPLGNLEVLTKFASFTQERSFFSGKKPYPFLDAMKPGSDDIEMTGPKGRLQSVHWPDRPDVFGPIAADGLPVWVNWTRWPAVTPAVDQGPCDVCWAHSATAAVEGLNAIRTHHLVKLSAQQLIDCCAKQYHNPFEAFDYIIDNGGIVADAHYAPQNIVAPGVTLDNYVYLTDVNEQTLKLLVAHQPVTATIGADEQFQSYNGGVLNGPNYTIRRMVKKGIAHSVTIVGYGELNRQLFWLIKNSWGVDWGYLGFAFIARNIGKQGGAFGIAREISYPVKLSPNSPIVLVAKEIESSEEDDSSEDDV